MEADAAIVKLIDALGDVAAALRHEACYVQGETAEILRCASNTAAVQAMHWKIFAEVNLGGRHASHPATNQEA